MDGRSVVIHLRLELQPNEGEACDKASVEGGVDTAFSTKLEGAILCEDVRSCAID